MSSLAAARSLVSLLQVLQGGYSSGSLVVRSTGATGVLPAHACAVPIIGGDLAEDAAVMVTANPAETDGHWDVAAGGTTVPVESLQGGTHVNLAAGTECRWEPGEDGIEAASEVASGGLSGGSRLEAFGALRQVRLYSELSQDVAEDLFRAAVGEYPAAVLAWSGTYPAEGSVSAVLGSSPGRLGRHKRMFKEEWSLFLVTSRLDQDARRRREAYELRDSVLVLLTDRTAWRGIPVSMAQGIEILDVRPFRVLPASYVDLVRFSTSYALSMRDERAWNEWLLARMRVRFAEESPPAGDLDVPDITVEMD